MAKKYKVTKIEQKYSEAKLKVVLSTIATGTMTTAYATAGLAINNGLVSYYGVNMGVLLFASSFGIPISAAFLIDSIIKKNYYKNKLDVHKSITNLDETEIIEEGKSRTRNKK